MSASPEGMTDWWPFLGHPPLGTGERTSARGGEWVAQRPANPRRRQGDL